VILQYTLLILGVWCCSTAAILIKLSAIEPMYLAAGRLLLAAVVLLPVHLRYRKRHPGQAPKLKSILLPAVFLAVHFMLWIVAARLIPAANGTLIANLVPLVMPAMLWVLVREKAKASELLATMIAMSGLLLMMVDDLKMDAAYLRGDGLALAAMAMLTVYLVLAKRHRTLPSIWLYVVPVYAVAGVMCLPVAVLMHGAPPAVNGREGLLLLGLVLLPTVLGHSLLNAAMWWFRGQVVSIFNLFQFTFAGVMAYLLLDGEMPTRSLYLAAAMIMLALIVMLWPQRAKTVDVAIVDAE
jgi:drug/metabolite transporter (DMT)-like permease